MEFSEHHHSIPLRGFVFQISFDPLHDLVRERCVSSINCKGSINFTSLIHYSREAFKREARDIIRLAEIEGLDAHANAVKIRLE